MIGESIGRGIVTVTEGRGGPVLVQAGKPHMMVAKLNGERKIVGNLKKQLDQKQHALKPKTNTSKV